ncbi:hypothetical protein XENORESO_010664 [Xenotaenia resolanae]|uniref:Uncharacterized protein n=1 Tax=Xenotaenia resolanae TaxID=208358 RepID=A0ABV0W5H8_9TELE
MQRQICCSSTTTRSLKFRQTFSVWNHMKDSGDAPRNCLVFIFDSLSEISVFNLGNCHFYNTTRHYCGSIGLQEGMTFSADNRKSEHSKASLFHPFDLST